VPLHDPEKMVKAGYELRKSVVRLRDLGKLSRDVFMKDPDKTAAAKYHFIVAVESAVDLCNHVIARNMYRVPDDYGDTFTVMGEVGALAPDLVVELVKMAAFRNRFLYLHLETDDAQVYELIRNRLNHFKLFLDAISRFLKRDPSFS